MILRRWVTIGSLKEGEWRNKAIDLLFSTRWQLRGSRAFIHHDLTAEATGSLRGKLAELGFSQDDDDVREDPSFPRAAKAPSKESLGVFAAAEMPFAVQSEGEADQPFSSQPRKHKDEATLSVLQSGALSKRLVKLHSDSPVVPCLQKWLAEGHALTKNIVVIALTNLKRRRRYKQALEVAEFVWRERVYVMDDADYMYRLYFLAQTSTVEDVEKCFASIPTKWLTEKVYNLLISFYIERDMLPLAKNTLEKLKHSGQHVSAQPFNRFMALYRHRREPSKSLELIKEMNLSNFSPDTRTYNLLLSTISKQGDADGVLRNYKAMKDAGIAPDTVTFSLVAKAYISAGMSEEAEALALEMKQRDSKNSHLVHDLLLTVYAEQKRPEDVKRVWKEVEKKGKLSSRSYGVMIECLGKVGLVQEAEKVAFRAEKAKRKPSLRVYNALLDVYCRHGMMYPAESLFLRIQKEGCTVNCMTYRHLVIGYLKLVQFDKAAEYLRASKKMLNYGYSRPWVESFLQFLDYLSERGEVDTAERSFKYFSTPRNTSLYNVLLKGYVTARIKVPNFLQRMSVDGVLPDARTLALLSELESL
ncbi:hypothetical protein GOP47_0025377 [Adiantum capillus-veneris]|uniref:Pentatricopeptide repeat-containing protein n=1 Tax=Adiantum capillus-veneris TaxID=13818 RepID=A0A9D4U172_ADICA|nr:hypothetical protein GOP47_0025377 [Adiantum capillus-veneris]